MIITLTLLSLVGSRALHDSCTMGRLSLALLLPLLLITSVVAQRSSYNYYRQNSYRQKTSRPNILFILADDLGWNDVGWVNPEVITPNLDSMATKGVILNQSYAQPLCTPSRAAYLTGLYPFHTGMQSSVVRHQVAEFLPLKFTLLPEKLKEAGYSTHLVGKWHLGSCRRDVTPTFRGFESFLGIYTGYVDFFTKRFLPITGRFGFDTNKPRTVYDFHSDLDLFPSPPDDYITEVFTDKAVEIIEKHDEDHPLFLALHHVAPHFPLQAPQRYLDLYPNVTNEDRRIYLGMVTAMDEGIGQVVQALERKGILENTIIVFESDNGGHTNFGASNFPLRGRKSNLYEGGVRVPTFVYSPGLLLSTPRVSEDLFHLVDWFPTLLKAVGISTDAIDAVDGKDQWDMIRYGFKGPRDIVIYNINGDDAAIRVGRFKLTEGNPGGLLGRKKRSVDATEPELHMTMAEALTEDLVHADEPSVREKRSASYHGHRTGYGGRSGYKRHTTLESDEDKIVKALEGLDDQWNIDSARQSRHLTVDTILNLLEAFGPNTPPDPLFCNCELYDLNADSSENQDLASQKPALVQFLHNLLTQFRAEEVEPVLVQPAVIDPRSVPSISNNVTSNTWCEEKRHRNRFYGYNHHLSYRRSYL